MKGATPATGRTLRPDAPEYPVRLANIHRPPDPLYVAGPFADWDRAAVGIVGTRTATVAGCRMTEELACDLARRGMVVVSGLARGIDGAAHRGALDGGGVTLAVVGTGLDVIYPQEHGGLRRRILATGALISEFPPGTPPRSHHFPRRNRILAGMCDVVVVVEASLRSGALNTAQWALEQGKEVLAVPRSPWESGSQGVNRLIRDGAAP